MKVISKTRLKVWEILNFQTKFQLNFKKWCWCEKFVGQQVRTLANNRGHTRLEAHALKEPFLLMAPRGDWVCMFIFMDLKCQPYLTTTLRMAPSPNSSSFVVETMAK
jgi:hypothetical protein